jgi:hypothetical protein
MAAVMRTGTFAPCAEVRMGTASDSRKNAAANERLLEGIDLFRMAPLGS